LVCIPKINMKILLVYLKEDEKLKACLNSLKKYSPELEVIKIKADNTTKIAEEIYNKKVDEINDDIMIWHPDMLATKDWYEKLKEFKLYDITGVKLIYPNGMINHFGGWIRHDGMGIHPHQYCKDIGFDNPIECPYVTGPGMIIKKEVFKKIKWDTQFTYFVDVDFCFQAREKGFSVGVIPVKLIHSEGEDGFKKRSIEKTQELQFESWKRFISKWMYILSN